MFGGIIQLLDLLIYQNLHPFLVFFAVCWGIFGFRVLMARRYKRVVLPEGVSIPRVATSALIMSFRDRPDILRRSLLSIRNQTVKFDEVIIVADVRESRENIEIFKQSGFRIFYDQGGNKRSAFAGAFNESSGEIVCMLAGDTIYPENILEEALKCFSNPKIGGVGFQQRIYERKRNLIRRFADIMYNLRYKITYPCLSSKGVLLCTTGETAFFRREPIERHLDEYLEESFLGRRCIIGDDRFLTSMVLKEGYDVVLQTTTHVTLTDCPNTLKDFVGQQLRWYRSNQRYSAKTLFRNWISGKSYVLKVHLAGFLVIPYLWIAILVWWVFNTSVGAHPVEILRGSALAVLPLLVLGFFLAQATKASFHLVENPQDWAIFPLYALFVTFVILPTFVYALVTIRNQGSWETKRGRTSIEIKHFAVLPLLLLAAVPFIVWEDSMPVPVLTCVY